MGGELKSSICTDLYSLVDIESESSGGALGEGSELLRSLSRPIIQSID